MFPIDQEVLTDDDLRKRPKSPGFLVANEIQDFLTGETKRLSEEEAKEITPILSQAGQAATPIPGFIWSKLIPKVIEDIHPMIINIFVILAAAILPVLVYLNAEALFNFLIQIGLFDVVDWLIGIF